MDLHHQLFDGSLRPDWAGPVTVLSRRRNIRAGQVLHRIEMSGVVVPVQVHPRYLPAGGHQHTFGLGLGFPDLSDHFINPSPRDSQLTGGWAKAEGAIAGAAAEVLGWGRNLRPRELIHAGVPANALHLSLTGEITRPRGEQDKEQAEPDSLTGDLTKVFPIRDVSGTRLRMETTGVSAKLRVTPVLTNWSRQPQTL